MGAVCCNEPEKTVQTANSNLSIENQVTGDKNKKYEEPDLLNENVTVQPINDTFGPVSYLTWAKTDRRSSVNSSRVNLNTIFRMDEATYTKEGTRIAFTTCEESKKSLVKFPLGNMQFDANNTEADIRNSKTLRVGPHRNSVLSVSVDPSRFRLERKCSIEEKYEILYQLGKGTFGEVKRVRDKKSMISRAVKVISKENCKLPENYMEEFEILKQLV